MTDVLVALAVFFALIEIAALVHNHRNRYRAGVGWWLCGECYKEIDAEHRQKKYQRGGQIMCPHCWEMTEVEEG